MIVIIRRHNNIYKSKEVCDIEEKKVPMCVCLFSLCSFLSNHVKILIMAYFGESTTFEESTTFGKSTNFEELAKFDELKNFQVTFFPRNIPQS